MDQDGNDDRQARDLLPGWSSLVVLLTIFAALTAITLASILKSDEAHVSHEGGGTAVYGPADFPEVDFDEPLLPAVRDAANTEQPGVFNVPPAPFSDEDIFPCSECHSEMDVDTTPRELEMMHEDIQLRHGSEDRWCFDCHNADDRDHLRLASGALVGFEESYLLCGQCHGTIYRDWRAGLHGRRRGYWNGAKSYMLCAHCHNPHEPAFKPIEPLPPPVRPAFLDGRGPGAVAASTEGDHEP